jgi:hypothetical protein
MSSWCLFVCVDLMCFWFGVLDVSVYLWFDCVSCLIVCWFELCVGVCLLVVCLNINFVFLMVVVLLISESCFMMLCNTCLLVCLYVLCVCVCV